MQLYLEDELRSKFQLKDKIDKKHQIINFRYLNDLRTWTKDHFKKAIYSLTVECVKIPELELSYKTKMIKFKFYGRRKKKVR